MGKARLKHQPKKTSMTPGPAQLANLRPISADPVANRLQGLTSGIGGPNDKRARCTGKHRGTGQPCKRIAAFGTGLCQKHGARRAAGLPEVPETLAFKAARRYLLDNPPPLELTRQPAWQALSGNDKVRGMNAFLQARAALLRAWLTGTETGDWGPWRQTCRT